MKKRTTIILLIVGLLVGILIGTILVGCSKTIKQLLITTEMNGQNKEATGFRVIEITNLEFYPAEVTIKKGTAIEWINMDSVSHQIEYLDGKIISNKLEKGDYFDYTFNKPGTYEYYCKIHPSIKGKITVTE